MGIITDLEGRTIPVIGGTHGFEAVLKEYTPPSSYATGGDPVSAADLGLDEVVFVSIEPSGGIVFEYDYQNEKIKAFWVDTTVDGAPLAQVTASTDLDANVTRIFAIGTPA